jgi:hypothetical protein
VWCNNECVYKRILKFFEISHEGKLRGRRRGRSEFLRANLKTRILKNVEDVVEVEE